MIRALPGTVRSGIQRHKHYSCRATRTEFEFSIPVHSLAFLELPISRAYDHTPVLQKFPVGLGICPAPDPTRHAQGSTALPSLAAQPRAPAASTPKPLVSEALKLPATNLTSPHHFTAMASNGTNGTIVPVTETVTEAATAIAEDQKISAGQYSRSRTFAIE